jgi:hypothetical protein
MTGFVLPECVSNSAAGLLEVRPALNATANPRGSCFQWSDA